MKSNKKRIRLLRRLAIAGCLAGLAVPATGAAMPVPADPPQPADPPTNVDPQIAVRHENGVATLPQHSYSLPSGFHTETQVASRVPAKPFTLPTGFASEVQRSAPSPTTSSPSPVVGTVTNDDGRTLAIALASIALAIALISATYGLVRLTRMQRRLVGS